MFLLAIGQSSAAWVAEGVSIAADYSETHSDIAGVAGKLRSSTRTKTRWRQKRKGIGGSEAVKYQ